MKTISAIFVFGMLIFQNYVLADQRIISDLSDGTEKITFDRYKTKNNFKTISAVKSEEKESPYYAYYAGRSLGELLNDAVKDAVKDIFNPDPDSIRILGGRWILSVENQSKRLVCYFTSSFSQYKYTVEFFEEEGSGYYGPKVAEGTAYIKDKKVEISMRSLIKNRAYLVILYEKDRDYLAGTLRGRDYSGGAYSNQCWLSRH